MRNFSHLPVVGGSLLRSLSRRGYGMAPAAQAAYALPDLGTLADGASMVDGDLHHNFDSFANESANAAMIMAVAPTSPVDRLTHEISLLKIRRRALKRKLASQRKACTAQARAARDVVRLAEKPWLVVNTPIATNAFRLYCNVRLAEYREAAALHADAKKEKRAEMAKQAQDGNESAVPKKRRTRLVAPRYPSAQICRVGWRRLTWKVKSEYVVAAKKNRALKQQMSAKLLSGCSDFERFAKQIESQVASAETIIRDRRRRVASSEAASPVAITKAAPPAKKRALQKALQDAWAHVVALEAVEHSSSGDIAAGGADQRLVDAKLRVFHLLQQTDMHRFQDH